MACSRSVFSPSMVGLSSMTGLSFLLVVARAAEVAVGRVRRDRRGAAGQRLAVQPGAQDRLDAAVGVRAQRQRPGAGGLGAVVAVAAGQADDAQHGPVALLGMRAGIQDRLRQRRGGRPGLSGPLGDPLRHWACDRWDSGMCSGTVVYACRTSDRGCEATRCPRWKTSTVAADNRTSTCWRASRQGTE